MDYYTKLLDLLAEFIVIDMTYPKERWKEIAETNGRYFISNRGRVLSLCRNRYYVLNPFLKDGYEYITVHYNG